ncbi:hypothetical protein DBV05_g5160 [Lasiodiplodia theobromae]|uniref:Uncharacterized protein n=1 Tax=Lasiodiplodia theobromae TaxID=45133 RepID=A0A5N5DEM2_9PEZI|nr:hypothetical protein DBV05_g5160 [Lasiodiplodia theobromae]
MPTTLEDLCEDVLEIVIRVQSDPDEKQLYSEEERINRLKHPSSPSLSSNNDAPESNVEQEQASGLEFSQGNVEHQAGSTIDTGICYVCGKDINDCLRVESVRETDHKCLRVWRCRGNIAFLRSLTVTDIMSLRRTSKKLHAKLTNAYLRLLKTSYLGRTGIAKVWLSYPGLQSLCASTASGLITDTISSLYVKVGHISAIYVRERLRKCKGYGSNPKALEDPVNWGQVKTRLSSDERKYMYVYKRYMEQERARATGENVRLLEKILGRLPNLRKIYVGNFGFPPQISSSRLGRFKPGEECEMRSAALRTVFDALASRPVPLEAFGVSRTSHYCAPYDEVGIWSLNLPEPLFTKLAGSLSTIKHLHLSLTTGEFAQLGYKNKVIFKRNLAPEGFTKDQGPRMILDFISAMPKLSSLHLFAATGDEFTLGFVRKLLRGLPTTLEELHLGNMIMSVSILAHFLNKHRHQLTELSLTKLYLVDESWTTVFRMMQTFLPHLQRAYLEQLWELHPEFSDKLFFFIPCRYVGAYNDFLGRRIYTVGRGGRSNGVYWCGKWEAHFRYDAMTMDDEDTRERAQSVREGLQHAVTESRREAVYYGNQDVDGPLSQKVLEYAAEAFGKTVKEIVPGPEVLDSY